LNSEAFDCKRSGNTPSLSTIKLGTRSIDIQKRDGLDGMMLEEPRKKFWNKKAC
jgi:hypothetical protein